MDKKGVVLMHKYEVGRLLGQGAFAKVYHARNLSTAQSVAIKVIDKEKVVKVGLFQQIKREISIMRLVRHPNIVQLHEVMANKAKIYFVMEYVKGGELFDRVAKGKLKEDAARKYFQQLIGAVDFCHSRGVYHRDLKPENLLVDENGNLKVSDFGLSALMDREKPSDGLLHTTCGTPAYVAPEVINTRSGYDGAKADIWSSGVVLFVLMAGYLPFQDANLMELYRKIRHGEFKCPYWFPSEVKTLLSQLLDPNPSSRITIQGMMNNPWFLKGYKPAEPPSPRKSSSTGDLSDVDAAFSSDCEDQVEDNLMEEVQLKPHYMNAFDIISFSPGFNLSRLFETNEKQGSQGDQRFATQKPAETIISRLREVAEHESFEVKKKDGTVNLRGSKEGRKGHLSINAEIFEVTPAFYIVEVNKSEGDTLEYQQFFDRELRPSLKDIVWLSNSSSSSSLS